MATVDATGSSCLGLLVLLVLSRELMTRVQGFGV